MNIARIRSRMEPAVRRFSNRARIKVWDGLAALQSSKELESSFVLWTSPDDASRRASDSPLKPYLCRLERTTLIEPGSAFAIADYGLLLETSVSNAYAVRDPYLKDFFGRLPSVLKYFRARILARYRSDLEAVVLLATTWPQNYFHFYRDFLPKILLLEEAAVDPGRPVVVPDGLLDQPFFRQAIQSKRLSRWKFISPKGQFIKSNSIVFCSANQFIVMDRSASPEPELLRRASAGTKFLESPGEVLALLDLDDGPPLSHAQRRVFLTRSGARGRTISNYEEVETLLRDLDFETVDTEGLSLRQQAELFRDCRYVIGIHGAGLVNIIHAYGHDLSLLQLRQPGEENLVTDFALMCYSLGFDHQEIFGTSRNGHRDASFHIDLAALRAGIDTMLGSPPPRG